MARKVTITLDDEIVNFVDGQAASNRSRFINSILRQEKRRRLESELEAAYRRDSGDANYREEGAAWDTVVGDGIDA